MIRLRATEPTVRLSVAEQSVRLKVQPAVVVQGSGGGGVEYRIGDGLKLDEETMTLSVDTADAVEQDNTRPVTSAAVATTVGNIEALLSTI